MLRKVSFEHGHTIYEAGQAADAAYIVGRGSVKLSKRMDGTVGARGGRVLETLQRQCLSGESFGYDALHEGGDRHRHNHHRHHQPKRTYTAVAESVQVGHGCLCAVLSVDDFHTACVVVGAAAMRLLRRPPRLRQEQNIRILVRMFEHVQFFRDLQLPALRAATCRFLGVTKLRKGEVRHRLVLSVCLLVPSSSIPWPSSCTVSTTAALLRERPALQFNSARVTVLMTRPTGCCCHCFRRCCRLETRALQVLYHQASAGRSSTC
eukprot:SAG22_NODE_280_length_13084_cov_3.480209_7_plen_264_part_00